MNIRKRILRSLASLFAAALLFPSLVFAAAGDVQLTVNGKPAVVGDMVSSSVQSLVIENGLVKITFGKDVNGDFSATSVLVDGKEIAHNLHGVEPRDVDARRTFYLDYGAGRGHLEAQIVRVTQNTPAVASFAVIDNRPGATHLEHHFAMLKGESGIHPWVLIDTREGGGGGGGGEMRSMYRFDMTLLDWAWTPERTGKQPSYATLQAISEAGNMGDETWRLADGTVYQKYDYCLYYSEAPMWGHYGHGYGAWFIPTTRESYAGGPLREELAVHQDALILNYIGGGHFSGGGSAAGTNGEKIHGPWYLYFNHADSPEALIADAKKTSEAEFKKVPYTFVGDEKLYPMERTAVTGQIKISHDRSAAGAYVILGKPSNPARGGGGGAGRAGGRAGRGGGGRGGRGGRGARGGAGGTTATLAAATGSATTSPTIVPAYANAGATPQNSALGGGRGGSGGTGAVQDRAAAIYNQSGDFIYYVKADADGRFSFPDVRQGAYTLYAWQTQGPITQSLAKDDVEIKGDKQDLGAIEWDAPYHPNLIMQVGKADRMADEYKFGSAPRTNQYMKDAPADLTFTVGKSKEAEDWFYAQPPGVWTVKFNVDKVPAGNAYLTVAIAGGQGSVVGTLNGTQVGDWSYGDDASVRRAANRSARYGRNEYTFPASDLKQGENTLTLALSGGYGLMYDTIVLESD